MIFTGDFPTAFNSVAYIQYYPVKPWGFVNILLVHGSIESLSKSSRLYHFRSGRVIIPIEYQNGIFVKTWRNVDFLRRFWVSPRKSGSLGSGIDIAQNLRVDTSNILAISPHLRSFRYRSQFRVLQRQRIYNFGIETEFYDDGTLCPSNISIFSLRLDFAD